MRRGFQGLSPAGMSWLIALATLAGMTVFQTAKRWIKPDITLLESNIVTVLVATLISSALAYIALRYRARSEERLREAEQKYRQLDEKLQHWTEEEKLSVSRELHEGLGQHLTGIEFIAKALANKLVARQVPEACDAEKLTELVNEAIGQTRQLSHILSPVEAEEEGFFNALRLLADYLSNKVGVPCELNGRVETARLPDPFVAAHLFRMVQESTTHAITHGRPTRIQITVREEGAKLCLTVWNNGAPLSLDGKDFPGSGLRLMRHRAQLIGADVRLDSPKEGGWTVTCVCSRGLPAIERGVA